MAKQRRKPEHHHGRGQFRVIGGAWRGRRLTIPLREGLRPTPDRVRETLFNWLQGHIVGSRCLDLFAGSGALGLEALSRGAGYLCLVDADAVTCRQLQANLALLQSANAEVCCDDARHWLQRYRGPRFDTVFIDPPFHSQLAAQVLTALAGMSVLAPDSRIYLEQARDETDPGIPPGWEVLRDKDASLVRYRLLAPPQES